MTDADIVRACTIGNRAVASRGSSRLSPRRKSKEPLSRRVRQTLWAFPELFDIFLNRLSNNSAVFPVSSHKLFSEVPL